MIRRWLCLIGLHHWLPVSYRTRYCVGCGRTQVDWEVC